MGNELVDDPLFGAFLIRGAVAVGLDVLTRTGHGGNFDFIPHP